MKEKLHCFVCKTLKSRDKFHKDKSRSTGLMSRCKECNAERRALREHDVNHMENKRKYMRKNRESFLYKWEARAEVRQALKKGILKKTGCVVCSTEKVEAHHPNHYKPLDVVWMCHKHHMQLEHGLILKVWN